MNFSYLMVIGRSEPRHIVDQALKALAGMAEAEDEVVIVCNGYEESIATKDFLCPVHLVSATDGASPAYARNAGLPRCCKDIIVFCDADDITLANRRSVLANEFDRTDADVVFTSMLLMDMEGNPLGVRVARAGRVSDTDFAIRCPIYLPAAAVRRAVLRGQLFPTRLRYAEDYFFWSQLHFQYGCKINAVSEPTIRYRMDNGKLISKNSYKRLGDDFHVRLFILRNSIGLWNKIRVVFGIFIVLLVRGTPHWVSSFLFQRVMKNELPNVPMKKA